MAGGGENNRGVEINPRKAFYGLTGNYDGSPIKTGEKTALEEKAEKFWKANQDLRKDFEGVNKRRERRFDDFDEDSKEQTGDFTVNGKEFVVGEKVDADIDSSKRNDMGPVKEDVAVETVWYDEAYQDLYKIMTGAEDEIQDAEERLNEHGIRRKEYSENDEANKQKYIDVLKKIVENDGEPPDLDELKKKIREKHKIKRPPHNESSDLPDELKMGELKLKTDGEMPYSYFSRDDGLLNDLDTIYGNNKEAGVKKTAYESLRKRGLEGIKRGELDPRIDYVRGKKLLQLLREYLSLDDDKAKEYQNKEELVVLLNDSGFTKMELIDQARRARVNGNIKIPENQLIKEENKIEIDKNLVLLIKHYYEEKRFRTEDEKTEELEKIELDLENLGIDLVGSDLLGHPELYQQTKLWLLSDDMSGNDLQRKAEKIILDVLKLKKKIEAEKVPVWDDEVINDLDIATWAKENEEERNKAWDRLEARGLVLRKIEVDDQVVFDAISFLTNKGKILKGKFKDNEEAKKFLKKYFGVKIEEVGGDEKLEDKKVKSEEIGKNEREKYLEYLGEGLLEDLRNIYPPFVTSIDGKVYSRSFHQLEEGNRLKRIWTKSTKKGFEGKDVRDFRSGQESIRLIESFLSMDVGYPKDWNDELMREMVVGRSLEQFKMDLEEARKRKQEKNKKGKDVSGDKVEEMGSVKVEDDKKERKELVFDEIEMLRDFGEFVAVNGGRIDVWNKWSEDLKKVNVEKRREVIKQLKYTWDLLQNRDMRLNDTHFPFWQKYAMAYLRSLGVAGKV